MCSILIHGKQAAVNFGFGKSVVGDDNFLLPTCKVTYIGLVYENGKDYRRIVRKGVEQGEGAEGRKKEGRLA